jgi:putative DNA primase/helicase
MYKKHTTMEELEKELGGDNVKYFKKDSRSKDDFSVVDDYPDTVRTRSGITILDTDKNFEHLMNKLGIKLRWNIMKRLREVDIPNTTIFHDDYENSALAKITDIAILNSLPTKLIDSHMDALAHKNAYHPIVDCIKAKPWDQQPRLERFIKTLRTENDNFSHKLVRRWMIGAIAAAFSEQGISLQGALVLQGKQYVGKTQWVKSLDPIDCQAVLSGSLLDPSNKDCLIAISRHWIVELGELDGTFNKADIARIKSYITNDSDEIRFPYAKKATRVVRRSAFIATVNESKYLVDTTGNRRWWTIPVISIDLNHGLDMQQVWAEVYHLWQQGESTKLNQHEFELLNSLNTEYENVDPLEEKFTMVFDFTPGWEKKRTNQRTATQVLNDIGIDKPTFGECKRMSSIIYKLTGSKAIKTRKGWFFTIPAYRAHSEMDGTD